MLASPSSNVREELSPGEQLLWAGQPKQGLMLRPADALLIPFSLLWGGFVFIWEFGVLMSDITPFALFGVPFVLISIYIIAGRFFWDSWLRAKTYYAVTNERVLILSGLLQRSVRSLPLKTLAEMSLTMHRDGNGTITFGQPSPFHMGGLGFSWTGSGRYMPASFEGIPDARRVHEMIRTAQREGHT